MTKLRGYIPTMFMMGTIILGATAANAGIVVSNRDGVETSCEQASTTDKVLDLASTLATFAKTGIVVSNRTGIVVSNRDETCRTGIIVSN